MKLSHKRKVQFKLKKHVKVAQKLSATALTTQQVDAVCRAEKVCVAEKRAIAPAVAVCGELTLTAKQQQILDIVCQHQQGINPKGIGLAAGQEDAKAAAWASATLKKLAEQGLVERLQDGSKILYKKC